MALFENFPYTNLHELNLNWLIDTIKKLEENTVISVNGQTGEVVLYQDATMELPSVSAADWSIVRTTNGTRAGILFMGNGTSYIVHGGILDKIFTTNNPPPYPVTRVNGMTGDITLYADRYVQLPPLTGNDIDTWNIFRKINNVNYGIQFDTDGKAYIMAGSNRYQVFTENDEPEYPVESVNGETGNIRLYYTTGNDIEFLGISPEEATTYNSWSISRALNDSDETVLSMELTKTGQLRLHSGNAVYTVYSTANPQPTWVDDPTADVIEVSDQASGDVWGFIRETDTAPVGIIFDNSVQNTPKAYIRYTDSSNHVQNIQLITRDDIPTSSGVVSINGLTGIVVLTGANIDVSSSDPRKINIVITDIETAMAFNETSDMASHNIPIHAYVYWNGKAWEANQAISSGDPLSTINLTELPAGGFSNALKGKLKRTNVSTNFFTLAPNVTMPAYRIYTAGNTIQIVAHFQYSGNYTDGDYTLLATINDTKYRPPYSMQSIQTDNSTAAEAWGSTCLVNFSNNGNISIYKPANVNTGKDIWINETYVINAQ